jgi:hypothetical protein
VFFVRCFSLVEIYNKLLLIRKSLAITALKPLVSSLLYRRQQTHPRRGRGIAFLERLFLRLLDAVPLFVDLLLLLLL